jgi:hypothetical protein
MSWLITGSEKTPVDPVFNNVSLLLHGNGTNGSTTITDSSPSPKTVTAVGNAQISTAIADPFGNSTGVIAFDGTGDYLTLLANSLFSFDADFTVEFWIYYSSSAVQIILDTRNADTITNYVLYLDPSDKVVFRYTASTLTSAQSVSKNQWVHVAVTRASQTIRLFINGVVDANTVVLAGVVNSASFPSIGGGRSTGSDTVSGYYLNGYIDDLRITKGIARYTANFTPPAAPFPDI